MHCITLQERPILLKIINPSKTPFFVNFLNNAKTSIDSMKFNYIKLCLIKSDSN